MNFGTKLWLWNDCPPVPFDFHTLFFMHKEGSISPHTDTPGAQVDASKLALGISDGSVRLVDPHDQNRLLSNSVINAAKGGEECGTGSCPQHLAPQRFCEQPTEFYHGTSLKAAIGMHDTHFRVDLSGTNVGNMLGDGVYETTTLEKTLNYVKPNEAEGIVFKLKASLGKCYQVKKNDPHMKDWHTLGRYDSAWSPAGENGVREENCIRNSVRIQKIDVVLGNKYLEGQTVGSVDSSISNDKGGGESMETGSRG